MWREINAMATYEVGVRIVTDQREDTQSEDQDNKTLATPRIFWEHGEISEGLRHDQAE
jgi:hypothetical protein